MVSDSFLKESLLQDYQRFCKINELLSQVENLKECDINNTMNESFRMIHIMKGTIGFLKLEKEYKFMHLLETKYLDLIKINPTKDDVYVLNVQIEKFLAKVVNYYVCNKVNSMISIKELFLKINNEFDKMIENKDIKIIPIYSEDFVSIELADVIYKITYQIIKNAISHGYNGKQMVIRMNGSCINNKFKLKISNDGIPINFDKLIKKAKVEKNIDAKLGNVLFLNNLSTNDKRNEQSGTGIGLNCVYDLIKKYHGNFQIISQVEDTLFYITLPLL